jgi:putative polysaccharide biosynthesis protein
MGQREPFSGTGRDVQPRVVNHPSIADLSNGALSTVRVLSCLNELGVPEIVAASFRMAIGGNVTVDNIHAGGIAAAVDIEAGTLGPASNLGDDAALGWLDCHPDTGGKILGRTLPLWADVLKLARWAHCAFADRVVIGWDIAILVEGPTLVEGNSGPDVDLMQRPLRRGIGQGRFAELLLYNLRGGQAAPAQANSNRYPLRSPPGAGSDIGHR